MRVYFSKHKKVERYQHWIKKIFIFCEILKSTFDKLVIPIFSEWTPIKVFKNPEQMFVGLPVPCSIYVLYM